jgi:hypothetical protein
MSDIRQRLALSNQVIEIVASCGRKFYHSTETGLIGSLVLAGGNSICAQPIEEHASPVTPQVIYIDPDTGQHTRISECTQWGEHIQPPARRLLLALSDYIVSGRKVSPDLIATPYQTLNGNQWGYDDSSAQSVRDRCSVLPMLSRTV